MCLREWGGGGCYVLVKAPLRVYYQELLNEDVVERHDAQPSALSGLETTS